MILDASEEACIRAAVSAQFQHVSFVQMDQSQSTKRKRARGRVLLSELRAPEDSRLSCTGFTLISTTSVSENLNISITIMFHM